MRCRHTLAKGRLEFTFETDEADEKNIQSLSYSMTKELVYFDLP